jgi:hypothetical protein
MKNRNRMTIGLYLNTMKISICIAKVIDIKYSGKVDVTTSKTEFEYENKILLTLYHVFSVFAGVFRGSLYKIP